MVTVIETVAENVQIAKAYKDLLRISYQKLTAADKKLIRLALDYRC
jgi:GTP pyrophosphokinase